MPIYEYQCSQCGMVEEVFQKISDAPLVECKHCSGKLQKLISQSTFHLKGSGWYVTDYARNSGSTNKKSENEGATAESKPAKTEPQKAD